MKKDMNNVLVTILDIKSELEIRRRTAVTQIWSSFRILTQDTRYVMEMHHSSMWSVLEGG